MFISLPHCSDHPALLSAPQVIKKLLEISMHVEPRIHQNFRM
jgi:hypothetical protein